MRTALRPAAVLLIVLTAITGVIYPLVVTGLANLLFARQAHGSLIVRGGHAVASELIGQAFTDPRDFWSRPSATSRVADDALLSTGSNLGPLNPALIGAVRGRIAVLRAVDSSAGDTVPSDLVTSSASGLDPHISPAAAEYQVARVARARALDPERVRSLVLRSIEPPTLGVLGEARVNVVRLNLALDELTAGAAGR